LGRYPCFTIYEVEKEIRKNGRIGIFEDVLIGKNE